MTDHYTHSEVAVRDNVTIKTYDATLLTYAEPTWPALPSEAKLALLSDDAVPDTVQSTHNVTCVGLYDYLVDRIDPFVTLPSGRRSVTHLAVGDNSVGGVAKSDTALNNEVYRAEVTSVNQTAGAATFTTLLDAGEANSYTLREIGLYNGATGSGASLLNHATIIDETKTVNKTMTLDVSLSFDDEVA